MKAIYLDTTKNLTIGILDEKFNWMVFKYFPNLKSTESLHFILVEMLMDLGLDISSIQILFTLAGPGSYTGMRVSEGIAQIFRWQGIKCFSFYHFQVPELIGLKKFIFLSNAFKGEFFLKEPSKEALLSISFLEEVQRFYVSNGFEIFSHHPEQGFPSFQLTSELIRINSATLFPIVLKKNMEMKPYYFRSIEKEFKVV